MTMFPAVSQRTRDPRENLLPGAAPGNRNAVRHGVYSRDALEPRVQELAEAIIAGAHTAPIGDLGAVEIAKLIAVLEAIDDDLSKRELTRKNGEARSFVDARNRLSMGSRTRARTWHPRTSSPVGAVTVRVGGPVSGLTGRIASSSPIPS